ncbi:hypothetical protein BDN70DRAFT_38370 [Pholiota conissans]|uniref:Uncharacterized protein n=1 Tax=Pholiota conissans TaxID=109636 RepID=A0A9P5Z349_9AGAR|nr:hypothetical protein BDN70DRAFT_38370 [Pholiota conissans]
MLILTTYPNCCSVSFTFPSPLLDFIIPFYYRFSRSGSESRSSCGSISSILVPKSFYKTSLTSLFIFAKVFYYNATVFILFCFLNYKTPIDTQPHLNFVCINYLQSCGSLWKPLRLMTTILVIFSPLDLFFKLC